MIIFLKKLKLGLGIVLLVTCFQTSSAQKMNYKYLSMYDLPRQSELKEYVTVLKNISNFYFEHIHKISISVAFGIFIGNVHLGYAMKYYKIGHSNWKADLLDVYLKNEEILEYYQWKIADEESGQECLKISQLFTNVSVWIDRVEHYKTPRVNYRTSDDFERFYHNWSQYAYVANVRRSSQWIPSPKESGIKVTFESNHYCLKLLAANSPRNIDGVCSLDDRCYRIVTSGSDIGYALCHRALLVLMARYSRGCSVYSPHDDMTLLDSLCSMGYAEAEYIAHHNYGLVDLLLEQISLCALHGRTEFLRLTWLNNILEFQTTHGCFSQHDANIEKEYNNNDLLDGRCSGHTTALATSVFSGAVRYIMEKYY